jgi:ABC-2 type transport system permease protein
MRTIKKYFAIYLKFIETSFTDSLYFRTSFVLVLLLDLAFYYMTFQTIIFLFNHVSTIGVWNKNELLFFTSFIVAIDQLHTTTFSANHWILAEDIRNGKFDFTLLKPASSIFISFLRYFRAPSSLNIFLTQGLLIYYGIQIHLSYWQWMILPILLLLSLYLFAIIQILLSCSMFFLIDGTAINFLRMQFQSISKWPDYTYSYMTRKFFTIALPFLLVGSAPVHFLLKSSQWLPLVYFLLAIIVFTFITLSVWRYASNHYHSPSS